MLSPHSRSTLVRGFLAALAVVASVAAATQYTVTASALSLRDTLTDTVDATVQTVETAGDNLRTTLAAAPETMPPNACLARCEALRASCVATAEGQAALGRCETQVATPCVDACRTGQEYNPPPNPPKEEPAPEEPSCTEDEWLCGEWSACTDGRQSRTCSLRKDCPTAVSDIPAESRGCDMPAAPSEPDDRPAETPTTSPASPASPASPTEPTREEPTAEPEESSETEADEEDPAIVRSSMTERAATFSAETHDDEMVGLRSQDGRLVDAAMAEECRANGILPLTCRDLLTRALAMETCAAEGIVTKSACQRLLTERNDGIFPGCEMAAPAQCETIVRITLLGYLADETKEDADALLDDMIRTDTVVAVPGITSIRDTMADRSSWWASTAEEGAETSSGIVVIDSDRDGLPDDFEIAHGYNPASADSDGNGVGDLAQARAEFADSNDPTIRALLARTPLAQPRGDGETDAQLTVSVSDDADDETGAPMMTGSCDPNATCLIYVYTYVPTVFTVHSDESGGWSYDIGSNVGDGAHVAYVVVTDEQGGVSRKSSPLSFFVNEARAADDPNAFLGASPLAEAAKPQPFFRWYLAGALLAIAAALALGYVVLGQKNATSRADDAF